MVAPAELPPMTPPRSSSANNSRSVRVFRYESTRRHCRPPSNQTPRAWRSGATNSGRIRHFAIGGVQQLEILRAGAEERRLLQIVGRECLRLGRGGDDDDGASGPPASEMNSCQSSGLIRPPPTTNSAPWAGPDRQAWRRG